jgi:hypothetical protein
MVLYQFVARTGTEEAFHCLTSAACQPWSPLTQSQSSATWKHEGMARGCALSSSILVMSLRMTLDCGDKEDPRVVPLVRSARMPH